MVPVVESISKLHLEMQDINFAWRLCNTAPPPIQCCQLMTEYWSQKCQFFKIGHFWSHKSTWQFEFSKLSWNEYSWQNWLLHRRQRVSFVRWLHPALKANQKGRPTNDGRRNISKAKKQCIAFQDFDPFIFKLGMNRCKFTFPLGWKRHASIPWAENLVDWPLNSWKLWKSSNGRNNFNFCGICQKFWHYHSAFFVEGEDDADTMRKVGKKLKLTPCQKKAKTNTTQEGIRISNVRIFSFLFWISEDKLERHLMKNSKGWKERIHIKPFSILKEMLRQSSVDMWKSISYRVARR